MKISNSKKELARIISENGGWREEAESAAQCVGGEVSFWHDTATKQRGEDWCGSYLGACYDIRLIGVKLPNWHQTILSRAEYFHLYPAPDNDGWIEWNGGECPVGGGVVVDLKWSDGFERKAAKPEAFRWRHLDSRDNIIAYRLHKPEQQLGDLCDKVTDENKYEHVDAKKTIEQLAADYRNAKDYANRKQDEADKANMQSDAALSQLEDAIAAIGFAITPLAATEKESEPVITDWRYLQVGDVVEGNHYGRMIVGEVCEIDEECHGNRPFRIHEDGGNPWWVTSKEFKFISRP